MSLLLSSTQADKAEKNVVQESSIIISKWKDHDDDLLLIGSLQYLDVATLIQKKTISKKWQQLCTKVIDDKCGCQKKKFQSKQELQQAVDNYSPGLYDNNMRACSPTQGEDIAITYGYPIDKWDVSNIADFTGLFEDKRQFNEPIGSWDVSKATTMGLMFLRARSFNQDISTWDVSNVTDMSYMFAGASSFDQDISAWDVSNVTNMYGMFAFATSFNNQDLSTWDVSNVITFNGMFSSCPFNERQLPWFREGMQF